MRVHPVDVQAGIVLVAHAAVKSEIFALLALKKGLDCTLKFAALFHPTPLLLQRLVKKTAERLGCR
jgi:hypothetical protein